MSYVVLARKWRPMRFEDLVGQDHVARTLGNAIETNRVAHAFLFTGVRGVGKTTSARILAKALNCMRPPGSVAPGTDPGPTVTPCLECPACLEIAQGTDVDVREIDGASYNGVDEVRKLQDSLPYQPTRDRYKIVIVDEVHMLSQSAWNAFLKTLEEPPPHVKFIFATTEVHKVPITILSRVQRFDFKLISVLSIVERLRQVLAAENLEADDEALSLVARQAAGSMRDAMSLLDQVIAWSGSKLVGSDVALVLGVASRAAIMKLARGLLKADAVSCLNVVSDLVQQGYDINHVAKDLLSVLRDMVVARVCSDPTNLLDLSQEERQDVQALASEADTDDLVRLHQGFSQGFDEVARSGQARAALEMLLVRLCRRPPLLPIGTLVDRLTQLERRLEGRAGGQRSSAATAARASAPRHPQPDPASPGRPRPREARQAPAQKPARDDAAEEPPAAGHAPILPDASDRTARRTFPTGSTLEAASPSQPVAATRMPSPVDTGDRANTGGRACAEGSEAPAPAPQAPPTPRAVTDQAPQVARDTSPPEDHAPPVEGSNAVTLVKFKDIVEIVRETRPELAAFLEHAAVLKAEAGLLCLAYPPESMFSDQVKGRDTAELLAAAAEKTFQTPVRVEFRFDYAAARGMDTLSADRVRAREERMRRAIADAKSHPRVADAIEVFGARIKDLKVSEGT